MALDLTITAELRRAGLAREVVRLVQEARKSTGLRGHRPDRAALGRPTGELAEALREHAALVAGTRCWRRVRARGLDGDRRRLTGTDPALGLRFSVTRSEQ